MNAARKAPAKRVREARRPLAFVKPQLLIHEAQALNAFLVDHEGELPLDVRSAREELIRVLHAVPDSKLF